MNIPVPPSIKVAEETKVVQASASTGAASLFDSQTVGALSSILGKSKPAPVVVNEAKNIATASSKYVDPVTASALTSILSKSKPVAESTAAKPVAEEKPITDRASVIRCPHCGGRGKRLKATPEGGMALVACPTCGGRGRVVSESEVKNWITSKINAALIALGVAQEKHAAVEDAVFTAALSGKLGNGTPSDETAQAIANMVTELAATGAAETPAVLAPEEPAAGIEVGADVGLAEPVEVEVPTEQPSAAPEVEPATAPAEAPAAGDDVATAGRPLTYSELEKLAGQEPTEEQPVSPEGEVPVMSPEDIETEISKMADEPEGIAAEKGVGAEDVDADELKMGIEVEHKGHKARVLESELWEGIIIELEHTDDPIEAQVIALDHLVGEGFPTYYSSLKRMEAELQQEKSAS